MKTKLLVLAAFFISSSVSAAVTYDSEGNGFVGKGEIQSLFDWNNAMLQQNAENLTFRFIQEESVTWVCEWFTGPSNNMKRHITASEMTIGVNSTVAIDSRKNSKGQITGFSLNGLNEGVGESSTVGVCTGNKTLVSDSISYSGAEEPILQVRFGADGEWLDLPVSL